MVISRRHGSNRHADKDAGANLAFTRSYMPCTIHLTLTGAVATPGIRSE
ncbi:hypothetical protein CBM2617_B150162 [Cupriavidus taiwanensis]|nr:hypothetical protein CBM2617_B150162 [Cupriavidus taiwanensis]SPD57649.1 protein of unknown function [Cupriavidus taiwanensis]